MIRTRIGEKERWLARRKAELGIEGRAYVAPNPGRRRTPEKRKLLQAIARDARHAVWRGDSERPKK